VSRILHSIIVNLICQGMAPPGPFPFPLHSITQT